MLFTVVTNYRMDDLITITRLDGVHMSANIKKIVFKKFRNNFFRLLRDLKSVNIVIKKRGLKVNFIYNINRQDKSYIGTKISRTSHMNVTA